MPSLRAGAVINTSALCVFFFFLLFCQPANEAVAAAGETRRRCAARDNSLPNLFSPEENGKISLAEELGSSFPRPRPRPVGS